MHTSDTLGSRLGRKTAYPSAVRLITANRLPTLPHRAPQRLPLVMAASILAIIRAAAPEFRNRHDQLAFAVHAAVLNDGFRLVAVGDAAQLDGLKPDAPDVSVAGWNSSTEQYSFAYLSDDEVAPPAPTSAAAPAPPVAQPVQLLLKAIVLGDTLLTTLATNNASTEPQVMELPVSEYTVSSSGSGSGSSGATEATAGPAPAAAGGGVAKSYRNLDQLSQTVASTLSQLVGGSKQPAAAGSNPGSSKKQKTEGQQAAEDTQQQQRQPQQQQQQPSPDPDYDPLRIGPPRRPLRVGEDDIMPLLGGGPGMVGGDPLRIGGGMGGGPAFSPGGGMHVGPGHPFFADRMRHPDLLPGRGPGGFAGGSRGGLPSGVRWDPINPEGLQGWSPDDFQRGGGIGGPGQRGLGGHRGAQHPDIDPDLGPPPPGRGADWDSMFG